MSYGNDGAESPDLDYIRLLLAAAEVARAREAAGLDPVPIQTETIPRCDLDVFGPELLGEVLAAVLRVQGPLPPAPPEAPEGLASGLRLDPDGTLDRFYFATGDMPDLARRVTRRLRAPGVIAVSAVALAGDLTMWVGAYRCAPTAEFLASRTANMAATLTGWFATDAVVPIFGPVLFTGGMDDREVFATLTTAVIAQLQKLASALPAGTAERFGPRLREIAASGVYLQQAEIDEEG